MTWRRLHATTINWTHTYVGFILKLFFYNLLFIYFLSFFPSKFQIVGLCPHIALFEELMCHFEKLVFLQ